MTHGRALVRWLLALLWALLLSQSAHAQSTIKTLDASDISAQLWPSAMLWHDPLGDRTLADWQQAMARATDDPAANSSAAGFTRLGASDMPLRRRAGAIWIAIHLNNPQAPLVRRLVVSPARLERVDAWLLTGPPDHSAQHLGRSGLSVPLTARPLGGNEPAWGLTVPSGASTMLLRLESRTALQSAISLWQPQAHDLHARQTDLLQAMESGALAITALLTLLFALWLRESTWAWYGITSLSLLVYQACFNGQAVLWLWPGQPHWTLPAMTLAVAATHTSTVLFVLSFVPRSHVPRLGNACALALAGLSVLGWFLAWRIGFRTGIVLQELVGLLLPMLLLWLPLRAWRRGDRSARFLLLSFSLACIASISRATAAQGWLPGGAWLENWLLPLGAVLTSTVLMLAMADRIRTLVKQRAQETLRHQEVLESRISEATGALIQARDQAEAAVKFKQRFLSRVSHDLRTPLHVLLGNAAAARAALAQLPAGHGPDGAQQRLTASVLAVERSGDDILQLSNELLDLARSETGELSLKPSAASLAALMRDLGETARWLAQGQRNQVEVQTQLAVPWVVLDAERVKQVLHNLLANACAATHDGAITLGARSSRIDAEQAHLEFWVRDTGRGISAEAQHRIFEPFEQIDGHSATGCAGLGLAIAQQWVQMMGSHISVASSLGAGSEFSWSMQAPIATALQQDDRALADSGSGPDTTLQGHVLVVDDLEAHRLWLQDVLHAIGLQVSLASGGRAAMAMLEVQANGTPDGRHDTLRPIDLVITDQNMPDGDGHTLLQWCRQHLPGLAVVALSSTPQPPDLFDAALLKPAHPSQLRPVLQHLLPPALDWAELRQLAHGGDGLSVDAWIARHRHQLGQGPRARGVIELGQSLQLAALVRWLR